MRACLIPGCALPAESRGWCATHYARWRRHGTPYGTGARSGFMTRVLRTTVERPGPSAQLEPHYRPWPCPPSATTTEFLAGVGVWRLSAAAQESVELELRRRARIDAGDVDLGLVFVDGRWRSGC